MRHAPANLGLLLVQVARAHRNRLEAALGAHGLHVGQEHAIYQLAKRGPVRQSELAQSLFIDVSTATKMLARLERDGLIRRETDPDDARASLVSLTPRGQRLVQPVTEIWAAVEAEFARGLTADERVAIRRLLAKVLATRASGETARPAG